MADTHTDASEGVDTSARVIVRNLAGSVIASVTPVPGSISDLKDAIEQQIPMPRAVQKLVMFGGVRVYNDDDTLEATDLEVILVTDSIMAALTDAFARCPKLQNLNVDGQAIDLTDAKALEAIVKNGQSMIGNHLGLGDAEGQALGQFLKHFTNLQQLLLNRNQIGNVGAKAIGDALKDCKNLRAMHLSCNQIGDAGARDLAENLQHCTKFSSIALQVNPIGNDGRQAITTLRASCPDLMDVRFS